MNATQIGLIGAAATVLAVVVTHWLAQRSGESRATQVREELLSRFAGLDARVTKVKSDVLDRMTELRAESGRQTDQMRAEIRNGVERVDARMESLKEIFALELKS